MSVQKITTERIRKMKSQSSDGIAMLTAYDFQMARLLDGCGIDMILVGDSLGNIILGHENTIPVTMEESLIFCKAVSRATKRALVIGDMPFGSFQISQEKAIENATRFLKEGGCSAVKIEGGSDDIIQLVEKLTKIGIPVQGHLGLTPQSVHQMGGYRKQAKSMEEQKLLLKQAIKLEKAGAFSIVLECIPEDFAKEVTDALTIPTIGIGSGELTNGQVLVINDLLGLHTYRAPSFVKAKVNLKPTIERAVSEYIHEVKFSSHSRKFLEDHDLDPSLGLPTSFKADLPKESNEPAIQKKSDNQTGYLTEFTD